MRKYILLFSLLGVVLPVMVKLPLIYGKTSLLNRDELLETVEFGSGQYQINFLFDPSEESQLLPAARQKQIQTIQNKLIDSPQNGTLYLKLGKLLKAEGKEDEAQKSFIYAVEYLKDKTEKEALNLAESLIEIGTENAIKEAIRLLASLLLKEPGLTDAYLRLAEAYSRNKEFDKAIIVLNQLTKQEPSNAEAFFQKAFVTINRAFFLGLMNFFSDIIRVVKNETGEEEVSKIIENLFLETFSKIDIDATRRAVALRPDKYKYQLSLGGTETMFLHYIVILMLKETEGDFTKALKLVSEKSKNILDEAENSLKAAYKLRPSGELNIYYALAMHYMVRDDFTSAQQYCREAIKLRPDLDQPYYSLLTVLSWKQALIDDNIEQFKTTLLNVLLDKGKRGSLNADDYRVLGCTYGSQPRHQFDTAYSYFSKSISLDQENADAHLGLGATLLWQGKLEEAIKEINRAGELQPNYWEIYHNLGIAYILTEKQEKAIAMLGHALELNPQAEDTQKLLNKLTKE